VLNSIWTFPGLKPYFAALKAKTPYGVFVHGALDPWFNRQYPLKHLKKWFYWPIQHAVLHDAEAVFFTTADAERDLSKQSFKKSEWSSVVVPYGINDPEATNPNHAKQIEAFHGVLPKLRGRRFLLFLARIHEKKGCDRLVEAFAKNRGTGSGSMPVPRQEFADSMRGPSDGRRTKEEPVNPLSFEKSFAMKTAPAKAEAVLWFN